MIVVNAKETKEPSGLSQLLTGTKGEDDGKFAKFLEAFNLGDSLKGKDLNIEEILKTFSANHSKDAKIDDSNLLVIAKQESPNQDMIDKQDVKKLRESALLNLLKGGSVKSDTDTSIDITKLQTDIKKEDEESEFLNQKLTNSLDSKDIKLIINSAKSYLKEQIDTIAKEQNIDIKSMPQTLKGLSDMAKKLGVNLEKISLEDIAHTDINDKVKTSTKEPIPLLDMKKQESPVAISSMKQNFVSEKKESAKKDEPLKNALHVKRDFVLDKNEATKAQIVQPKEQDIAKAQIVQSRGEIVSPKNNIDNISQESKTQLSDPLAKLLFSEDETDKGDKKDTLSVKTTLSESKVSQNSFVNVPSSDSLEVKAKEAQQMVRHLATDLKEAVDDYKPPFTRLKMTLNPAKLGEVEVTLIQRGSNVHININSNNTALTLLAQNVNELKTQLANNGVVNTSMQFSTSHGEHQQQEGRHQQFQAYKELDQMSEEELEMITSMEIILPRYV